MFIGLVRSLLVIGSDIEKGRLLCSVPAEFGHLVDGDGSGVFLLTLSPTLGFVPLPLLARVFLLALGKC